VIDKSVAEARESFCKADCKVNAVAVGNEIKRLFHSHEKRAGVSFILSPVSSPETDDSLCSAAFSTENTQMSDNA